jgi:hypothetical protein
VVKASCFVRNAVAKPQIYCGRLDSLQKQHLSSAFFFTFLALWLMAERFLQTLNPLFFWLNDLATSSRKPFLLAS